MCCRFSAPTRPTKCYFASVKGFTQLLFKKTPISIFFSRLILFCDLPSVTHLIVDDVRCWAMQTFVRAHIDIDIHLLMDCLLYYIEPYTMSQTVTHYSTNFITTLLYLIPSHSHPNTEHISVGPILVEIIGWISTCSGDRHAEPFCLFSITTYYEVPTTVSVADALVDGFDCRLSL